MEFWGLIIPVITLGLYAGMFLANGSILYGIMFARHMTDGSQTHLARVLAIGAWIGIAATCLRVPAAAGNLGGDLASAVDPQFLGLMMGTSLGLSTVLAALGFIMAATLRITTQLSLAPLKVSPAICNCPIAKPNVPPLLASLTPPVSGLLQPTDRRLALEKFVPANGPTEKISGFSGASGSIGAISRSTSIRAIRYRPASASSRPTSWRSEICR